MRRYIYIYIWSVSPSLKCLSNTIIILLVTEQTNQFGQYVWSTPPGLMTDLT